MNNDNALQQGQSAMRWLEEYRDSLVHSIEEEWTIPNSGIKLKLDFSEHILHVRFPLVRQWATSSKYNGMRWRLAGLGRGRHYDAISVIARWAAHYTDIKWIVGNDGTTITLGNNPRSEQDMIPLVCTLYRRIADRIDPILQSHLNVRRAKRFAPYLAK